MRVGKWVEEEDARILERLPILQQRALLHPRACASLGPRARTRASPLLQTRARAFLHPRAHTRALAKCTSTCSCFTKATRSFFPVTVTIQVPRAARLREGD